MLKAPFPYFGGKSKIAHAVWDALGDVPNYVEPFAGSAAVLLARPHEPQLETINDADGRGKTNRHKERLWLSPHYEWRLLGDVQHHGCPICYPYGFLKAVRSLGDNDAGMGVSASVPIGPIGGLGGEPAPAHLR